MKNTADISRNIFEPCLIACEESPFLSHERKTAAHADRFSSPIREKEETELPASIDENAKK